MCVLYTVQCVHNKASLINHALKRFYFLCVLKKSGNGKKEGIRAWGKKFYVLSAMSRWCHIFIGWSVNVDRSSKHNMWWSYCIILYLWSRDRHTAVFEPLSLCDTGPPITEITMVVSRCQSFVWDSWKSCNVFQAYSGIRQLLWILV